MPDTKQTLNKQEWLHGYESVVGSWNEDNENVISVSTGHALGIFALTVHNALDGTW